MDEDGVGRVKRDRCVRGLAETVHTSISRRSRGGQVEMVGLGGLSLKTTVLAHFPVGTSKSGARLVRLDSGDGIESTWFHRKTCVKTKQGREDGVSI